MGENCGTKPKISLYSSDKIHFQTYVESVKQRKIPWNIFEKLLKDYVYSDMERLKFLNAILLSELTKNYSEIDRSRYLNSILLPEFKEFIQREDNLQNDSDLNNEIIKNRSNENFRNNDSSNIESEQINPQNEYFEEYEKSTVDSDTNEEKIKEGNEVELLEIMENERNQNLDSFSIKVIQEESQTETVEIIENEKNEISIKDNSLESKQVEPDSERFPCHFCNKVYGMNFHLKQHIRKNHTDCDKYVSQDDLNAIKDKTQGEVFDQFDKSDATVHEGDKDFKCESCGKSFKTLHGLETHLHTVHDGIKNHKCESCGKNFFPKSAMNRHIYTVHQGHKDYKCESCGKSFSEAGKLKRHIHIVHEGHKDHKCESCGKSFSEAGKLKRHIHTVHEGHKDYKCESCGKSFTEAGKLKGHIHIVHEDFMKTLEMHLCKICGKIFNNKNYLSSHMTKIHNKQPCLLCGKMFHGHRMKLHIASVHTEDHLKPFPCSVCPKGFAEEKKLKDHMNIHTGNKPYECRYCHRGFANKRNTIAHEKIVHQGYKSKDRGLRNLDSK